jgi:hypothetical protein
MDDHERSAAEELDYQLAARYFASALEDFDRLHAKGSAIVVAGDN